MTGKICTSQSGWRRVLSLLLMLLLAFSPMLCRAEQANPSRDYSTLPELMVMQDGTPVTTQQEFAARRQELLQLFADTMYGTIPTEGFQTSFEVLEEGETLEGKAIRKQISITVTTEKGSSQALMLLILPKSDAPVPVVYGLSFGAVHTVLDDPQILASYSVRKYPAVDETTRGTQAGSWCIAEAVERGYGIAVAFCEDFAPDNTRTYRKRVISLFDDSSFKAISAWAFGLERMADYLHTDAAVDATRLAVAGTSRLGKAALWAGAHDERAALTIATVSGTCGASLSRSNTAERIGDINLTFRWWLPDTFKSYSDNEDELPIDQHELIACIAPRKIYVSSAETDLSTDSQGSWNALMLSRDAFRLYGMQVIQDDDVENPGMQPGVDTRVFTESMAYHIRSGKHGITAADWKNYFDYMDAYLGK